jgi:heptosyltransferase-3
MNILILRGGALGDLILTLPALARIRKGYPDAFIELWGRLPQAILAEPQFVNQARDLERAEVARLFLDGTEPLRIGAFDLVVSFLFDPDSTIASNLTAAGIPRVISVSPKLQGAQHAADQLASGLDQLGLPRLDSKDILLGDPRPTPERIRRLAFHIGSGSHEKNWPLRLWTELVRSLESEFDECLLIGGEADTDRVKEFQIGCKITRLRTLQNADLRSLVKELAGCRLFVGHDSGVTHLAAATGIPTIALFGPTDSTIWGPRGANVRIITSPNGRMESIGVKDVAAEGFLLLASSY